MGGLFQLFWERGAFQELALHPLFDLLWLTSELSWHLRVCHLAPASVSVQWGPLEVKSSAKLDLTVPIGLCCILKGYAILLKVVPWRCFNTSQPQSFNCRRGPVPARGWWCKGWPLWERRGDLSGHSVLSFFSGLRLSQKNAQRHSVAHNSTLRSQSRPSMGLYRKGSPFPGPESGLLPNTQKWVVWGGTQTDKAKNLTVSGPQGGEQQGTQEDCSATCPSRIMVTGLTSGLSLASHCVWPIFGLTQGPYWWDLLLWDNSWASYHCVWPRWMVSVNHSLTGPWG